jgi:hypothetical protein
VVDFVFGSEGDELSSEGIPFGVTPIDQSEDVRSDAKLHGGFEKAIAHVFEEFGAGFAAEQGGEFVRMGQAVAKLPAVVEEVLA